MVVSEPLEWLAVNHPQCHRYFSPQLNAIISQLRTKTIVSQVERVNG